MVGNASNRLDGLAALAVTRASTSGTGLPFGRWGRATPPERSISPVLERQGPMVTTFETFFAVFGTEPTLAGSRLAGRPCVGPENLPGSEGGASGGDCCQGRRITKLSHVLIMFLRSRPNFRRHRRPFLSVSVTATNTKCSINSGFLYLGTYSAVN